MQRSRLISVASVAAIVALCVHATASALDGNKSETSPQFLSSTYDGDTGLFHLPIPLTLASGQLAFSGYRSNVDRSPGDLDVSEIGFNAAVGITRRVEAFGTFAWRRIDVDDFPRGIVVDYPVSDRPLSDTAFLQGVSDIRLGAKFKILHKGPSLAARGVVKIPAASRGLGTDGLTANLSLLAGGDVLTFLYLAGQIGLEFNGDSENRTVPNAVKWGVGAVLPINARAAVELELTGKSYPSDASQISPVDLVVGPVFRLSSRVLVRPAFSQNRNFGPIDSRSELNLDPPKESRTSWQTYSGVHFSVTVFLDGDLDGQSKTPRPRQHRTRNRPPVVYCLPAAVEAQTGSTVHLIGQASDADGDQISFVWSLPWDDTTNAIRLIPKGSRAEIRVPEVASVGTIRVTVRAVDSRGGIGEGVCSVRVAKSGVHP